MGEWVWGEVNPKSRRAGPRAGDGGRRLLGGGEGGTCDSDQSGPPGAECEVATGSDIGRGCRGIHSPASKNGGFSVGNLHQVMSDGAASVLASGGLVGAARQIQLIRPENCDTLENSRKERNIFIRRSRPMSCRYTQAGRIRSIRHRRQRKYLMDILVTPNTRWKYWNRRGV